MYLTGKVSIMRRVLSVLLAVGILLGATACGDDKKDDKATEQTDKTTADEPGSSSGGSKADEYCAAVDAFVKEAKGNMTDPSKTADITQKAQDLATKAQELATGGLSTDETKQVSDCSQKASAALSGG